MGSIIGEHRRPGTARSVYGNGDRGAADLLAARAAAMEWQLAGGPRLPMACTSPGGWQG
jgi:hypothetical protein